MPRLLAQVGKLVFTLMRQLDTYFCLLSAPEAPNLSIQVVEHAAVLTWSLPGEDDDLIGYRLVYT